MFVGMFVVIHSYHQTRCLRSDNTTLSAPPTQRNPTQPNATMSDTASTPAPAPAADATAAADDGAAAAAAPAAASDSTGGGGAGGGAGAKGGDGADGGGEEATDGYKVLVCMLKCKAVCCNPS